MSTETPVRDTPQLPCIHPASPTTHKGLQPTILERPCRVWIHIRTPISPVPIRIPRRGARLSTSPARLALHDHLGVRPRLTASLTRTPLPSTARPRRTTTPTRRLPRADLLPARARTRHSLIPALNRRPKPRPPCPRPCPPLRTRLRRPGKGRCTPAPTPWILPAPRRRLTIFLRGIRGKRPSPSPPRLCLSVILPLRVPRSTLPRNTSQWLSSPLRRSAVPRA